MNCKPHISGSTLFAIAIVMSLVGTAPVHAQKIYKYVDENGNTMYTQRLPAGVAGKEVKPKFRQVTTNEATTQLKELSQRANPEKQPPDNAAKNAEHKKRVAKAEKANCDQARKNLEILNTSPRVQAYDAKGNPVLLDDEGRAAKVSEAQRDIQAYCK